MSQGEGGGRPPIWTDETIEELRLRLLAWSRLDDSLYLQNFLADNDLYNELVRNISEKGTPVSDKFAQTIKIVKAKCEARKIEATRNGSTPLAFGIFDLKANHEWIETEKRQLAGHDGGPLEIALSEKLKEARERAKAA